MLKPSRILPLTLVVAAVLTGCGGTSQGGQGAANQHTQAEPSVSSAPASTATAQSSTAAPATTSSAAPKPTVREANPQVSEQPASPAPTGTVVTVPADQTDDEQAADTPGTPSHGATPSSAAGVAVCDYGQLYIAAAVSNEAGAAGSRYITLTFTNTGDLPCSMNGYPTVFYVDAAGQQIGASAAQASEWSTSGVVLEAGKSTTATLRETRAQLFGGSCQGTQAAGYSIQAPGASQALVLNFSAEACSNDAVSQLSVGAVGAQP